MSNELYDGKKLIRENEHVSEILGFNWSKDSEARALAGEKRETGLKMIPIKSHANSHIKSKVNENINSDSVIINRLVS